MYLDRRFLRSETWIFIFHLIDSLSLHLHFKFKESKSNAGGKIVSVFVGSGRQCFVLVVLQEGRGVNLQVCASEPGPPGSVRPPRSRLLILGHNQG